MPGLPFPAARKSASVRFILPTALSALAACSSSGPTGPAAGFLKLYVANSGNNTITVYPADTTGNVAPIATISTGLNLPIAVAVDAAGRLYVANRAANSIAVYAAGATGNASPMATIVGDRTKLSLPTGIALDGAGELYVANSGNNRISVYPANATGNVAPTDTIVGDSTGLDVPVSVAFDGQPRQHGGRHVYVVNNGLNSGITLYPAGISGNVPPIVTITGLRYPFGIAVDTVAARFYVGSNGADSVTIYPVLANPLPNPPATAIVGPSTGLSLPVGVALDTLGRLYVANPGGPLAPVNSITIYPAGATGNFPPIATIAGDRTGLNAPVGIAIGP